MNGGARAAFDRAARAAFSEERAERPSQESGSSEGNGGGTAPNLDPALWASRERASTATSSSRSFRSGAASDFQPSSAWAAANAPVSSRES